MAENLNLLEQGKIYHIYNHTIGNELLFKKDENYHFFLSLIRKNLSGCSNIFSYVLMPNHFHFLIKFNDHGTNNKNYFSNQLSKSFNSYSQAYNKVFNRRGSLFRHRFRRKEITDEIFLRNLIIYINANPVHHDFCNKASQWKYSSYHALIDNKPTAVDKHNIIELFGNLGNLKHCLDKKIDLENEWSLE